jgi:ATP-dependent Clp protease ATP-binding subunit ClpA
MAPTITFTLTSAIPNAFLAAGTLAAQKGHLALEPEHLLLSMFSNVETTAAVLVRRLGLDEQELTNRINESLPSIEKLEVPIILQRGGRLRPLMGMSLCYARDAMDGTVYSANLIYAMVAVVPGPAFDLLRSRSTPTQAHDAIFASIREEPAVWKEEFERRGAIAWEITSSHMQQIVEQVHRGYAEIPFT